MQTQRKPHLYLLFTELPFGWSAFPLPLPTKCLPLSWCLKTNSPIIFLGKSNVSLLWKGAVLLLAPPFPRPCFWPSCHVPSLVLGSFSSLALEKKSFASLMFFSGLVSGISSVHVLWVPRLAQGSGKCVLTAVGYSSELLDWLWWQILF